MDHNFLPYFINEQIYLVKKAETDFVSEKVVVEELEVEEEKLNILTTGSFKRNILLVVDHPGNAVLPPVDFEFLIKVLGSVKLGEADVAVLNINNLNVHNLEKVLSTYDYKIMISFGTERVMEKNVEPYKITNKGNSVNLLVDDLSALSQDKAKKMKLWGCLQMLFLR